MVEEKRKQNKFERVFDRFEQDSERESHTTGLIRQLVGLDPTDTPPAGGHARDRKDQDIRARWLPHPLRRDGGRVRAGLGGSFQEEKQIQ